MAQHHPHELTARCPGCGSEATIKDGHVRGRPRRRCKTCARRYMRTTPRGYVAAVRHEALKLYASGLSMNRTGQLLGVSCQTVMRWVRVAGEQVEARLPDGRVVSVEADEMHHYIQKNGAKSGSSKPSTS
jgi:transposase-like protein